MISTSVPRLSLYFERQKEENHYPLRICYVPGALQYMEAYQYCPFYNEHSKAKRNKRPGLRLRGQ